MWSISSAQSPHRVREAGTPETSDIIRKMAKGSHDNNPNRVILEAIAPEQGQTETWDCHI